MVKIFIVLIGICIKLDSRKCPNGKIRIRFPISIFLSNFRFCFIEVDLMQFGFLHIVQFLHEKVLQQIE